MQTEVKIIDFSESCYNANKVESKIIQLFNEGWQLHNDWLNCYVSASFRFSQMFVKYSSNQNKRMIDYKLLYVESKGHFNDALQDKINVHLAKGWQLYGKLYVDSPGGV
jgi:hypothetical protein